MSRESGTEDSSVWVFGYGSLLWKTNFSYEEKLLGHVKGYARRFWQGSTDHRGIPGAPGRVVTLIQESEECTYGIAYKVQPQDIPEVMAYLKHREKGGYTTHQVLFHPDGDHHEAFTALVYIGTQTNPDYLGPAPMESLAKHIAHSHGPSGCNIEYALELARAVRTLFPHVNDQHLFGLEARLNQLSASTTTREGCCCIAL